MLLLKPNNENFEFISLLFQHCSKLNECGLLNSIEFHAMTQPVMLLAPLELPDFLATAVLPPSPD